MKKSLLLLAAVLIIALYAIINNHILEKASPPISSKTVFKENSLKTEATQPIEPIKDSIKNEKNQQERTPSISAEKAARLPVKNVKERPSVKIDTEELTNNTNSIAIERITRQLERNGDGETAFFELVALKDYLKGENLQSAMKQMQMLSEFGGNDVLIETFLDQSNPDVTEQDRIRILTYVNPGHELSENQVESLFYAYSNEMVANASDGILRTLSQAGGEYGAQVLIDIIESETNNEKYIQQMTALGYSDSPAALDYLNQTLDDLVRADAYEQDPELINFLRNLILQKKNQ